MPAEEPEGCADISLEYPRLRYLEAFPHEENGRTSIVLRDPTQISDRMLVVSPEFCQLLPLLNGSNSLRDIQAEISRRLGQLFFMEDLTAILQKLDEAYFLESEGFERYHRALVEEFRAATIRPASHAGSAYPADPAPLLEEISSFYSHPDGAGIPGATCASGALRALVAPHIDLRSGGPTYTHAYRALAESPKPDLVVIFGTGHHGLPEMYSISDKDFETPLGVSRTDRDFLQAFRARVPEPLFSEDFSHRHEHTIEFQLVFLHHLFRAAPPPILPILCSFSYDDVSPESPSPHRDWMARLLEGLRDAERETGKRACFIASVDFAHIGPRYGDASRRDQRAIEDTLRQDGEMLEPVMRADAQGFYNYIAAEHDRRRICGFPALYTILQLLDGERGRLFRHSYAVVDQQGSFVTFASLAFGPPDVAQPQEGQS
jgi:AmmeMemoRadiSam system protein B